MSTIELALASDDESILGITSATGTFTPVEVGCVEELWSAYRGKGEASGYVFLVSRDYG